MTRDYTTAAIVLGSRKLGEADRIVDIFTAARGRVPTVVKGIRKVKSRWGGRLEPFTHLQVQLHEGRNLHTLTSADTVKTNSAVRDNPSCLRAGQSVIEMVSRTTPELHPKPRTYNLLIRFLEEMSAACLNGRREKPAGPGAAAAPAKDAVALANDAAALALAAQLKILLLAGFLPHVLSCAACGAESGLDSFSARSGGALCRACRREAFSIRPGSLAAMRRMLEEPMSAGRELSLEDPERREIRRAIREICEYHLGVRLRVEPW